MPMPAVRSPSVVTAACGEQGSKEEPKYLTLKACAIEIDFMRDEDEDEALQGLQLSLSFDSMTALTKVKRTQEEGKIDLNNEMFIFHMNSSPIGAMLMVKLNGVYRTGTSALGSTLFDLSTIAVGEPSMRIVCDLQCPFERKPNPTVTLDLKLVPRRKSFTFSFLRDQPLFHCQGYTITAEGIGLFPNPYKKNGLPAGILFQDLEITRTFDWAQDINGFDVFRAVDNRGGSYTIQQFNVMHTECRNFLIATLDGLTDALPESTIKLCDAFLIGGTVCVVLDDMGGVYLRDAIRESGACPELVASIILRQVLKGIQYLHETANRLHLDIDARNIICLPNGECRLGGFCYSVKHIGKNNRFSGPFYHMSPERILGLECSFAADVWSVGILAMEIALGSHPYDFSQYQGVEGLFEFRKMVSAEDSPTLKGVKGVSDVFRGFVSLCLHKQTAIRGSPTELLMHPFLQRYEEFSLPAGTWLHQRKKRPSVDITFTTQTENISQGKK